MVQPYVEVKQISQKHSHHPYLRDVDGVRLPVEDGRVIIHVSDLDVYCVFHHLRRRKGGGRRETPS